MANKDGAGSADLTVVDKKVVRVRGSYGCLEFILSATPEQEWTNWFHREVDFDPATASLARNAGASVDGDTITWEVHNEDIEAMWEIVKRAVVVANDEFGKVIASRLDLEAKVQEGLDARDKLQQELEKKLKALK